MTVMPSINIRVQPYLRAISARCKLTDTPGGERDPRVVTANQDPADESVTASDLVGCRYRYPQRLAYPTQPPHPAEGARRARIHDARAIAKEKLPRKRAIGDGRGAKPFLRVDLDPDDEAVEFDTLEALAAGADLITGAVFAGSSGEHQWRVRVDILARRPDGSYLPVIVSNHRVARRDERSTMLAVATNRLALSEPMTVPYRQRHHVTDGYRLALAARALADLGVDSGLGGAVGQDRDHAFITETAGLQQPLDDALAVGFSTQPRRLKECATCRFWPRCEPELRAADEISLVLPGDKARTFRERGIETVADLIDSDAGEPSALARAWRDGVTLLKRTPGIEGPRADVEVDVDMEAYLDQGAYLWGAFDGTEYRGFVTWARLGGAEEAENFAAFWSWLMARRAAAHNAGQTFAAYCYSAHGENHWLRLSARRFHGKYPGVPSEEEVAEFIESPDWVDLFTFVRRQLLGPEGIGLKVVAREAGYAWTDGDLDGEESVNTRRIATSDEPEAASAREALLRYNEDDTRATAVVRAWLLDGAPGVTGLS